MARNPAALELQELWRSRELINPQNDGIKGAKDLTYHVWENIIPPTTNYLYTLEFCYLEGFVWGRGNKLLMIEKGRFLATGRVRSCS